MTLQTSFEKEPCGRCGGSGRYSYNQMDGDRCYGCGGKGERLTKRGAAASAFYVESCLVPAVSVEIGDTIQFGGVTNGGTPYGVRGRVEAIEDRVQRYKSGAACADPNAPWQEAVSLVFSTTRKGTLYMAAVAPEERIRKYWPAEINAEKVAAALAFQAALTKAGKPRKAA